MFGKINIKQMMPKVGGLALGTVAAGFIQGAMNKGSLSPMVRALGLIGAGALLPGLMGKSPLMAAAGDGILSKGVDALLRNSPLSAYVGAIDDNIFGADDDGVYGPESYDELPGGVTGIAAGPDGSDNGTSPNTF